MHGPRQPPPGRPGRRTEAVVGSLVTAALFGTFVTAWAIRSHGQAGRGHSQPRSGHSAGAPGHPGGQGGGSPLSPSWEGSGRPVTLAFGGDIHFEGPLAARLAADPATALGGTVRKLFAGADLSMANFESALIDGSCTDPQPKQFVFYAQRTAIVALKSEHITLVSEANNHGEDCGRPGLTQALAIARAANYPVIGIGRDAAQALAPYRARIHGQRIAIIAATEVLDTNLQAAWTATATQPGLASAYAERELVAAVQQARRDSDTVVVFLHWGTETQQCPNPLQEPLARALVRAGADIVIGAHAHVQLGAGYLGTAFVDYGLGNLAFYDSTPPESYSGALHITVTGRHIDSFSWRPAQLAGGLPIELASASAAPAAARWRSLRGCTGLSRAPTASLATRATETGRFTGPAISPTGP